MHPGRGPGLTDRRLGERGGVDTVTLSEAEMPNHTHTLRATAENGEQGSLTSAVALARARGGAPYQSSTSANLADMDARSLPTTGGSQAHNNQQPYLTVNFIIALAGLYPSRS